ncbi:hypothetical protein EDC01DRAFT_613938 [Geopyxis carbonaria]|nr:hypothetical protein EDC01DRAFT_613938 [Geopyxis carbonaria]
MAVLACKHNYCRDCVTSKFSMRAPQSPVPPFTCCKQRVTLPHVGNFDAKFTKAYSHLLLEKSTKNPLYCAQPSCAAFIPDSQIQGGEEGVCLECKKRTCRHCKLESHHGVCAEDKEGLRLKELAKTKGWKECPGCKSMVERTVGCLHMTCTCTTQFCYSCGLVYRDCPKTCGR